MPAHTHYRSVFLSDLHIGFRGFNATGLLAFLKSIDCEYLYLVGDIFDLEAMRHGVIWNQESTAVIRRLLKMAKNGTKIFYLVGNHDEPIRQFIPLDLGYGIEILDEAIHWTNSGHSLMVIHGDKFDFVVGHMRWLTRLGSRVYDLLLRANGILHSVRTRLGFRKYWSLAAYLKAKAKKAVSFIHDFEQAACLYAQNAGCVGVVCGHIHTPALKLMDTGMIYGNCGDQVESLSALVEDTAGTLKLVYWHTPSPDITPA